MGTSVAQQWQNPSCDGWLKRTIYKEHIVLPLLQQAQKKLAIRFIMEQEENLGNKIFQLSNIMHDRFVYKMQKNTITSLVWMMPIYVI